jgi:hypothetical protein
MAFHDKELTVLAPIAVAGRRIKRYHIDQPEQRIEPAVEKAAYDLLPQLLPDGDGETLPASWVVLHRGADTGAYLLAYSWVWGNVVQVRCLVAGQPALDCPDTDPSAFVPLDRPLVGCVWELGVFEHERTAWIRHVLEPDEPDLDRWLTDTRAEGPVGR